MIAISARCFPQQWGKILSARKPDPYLAPPWLRTQPRFHIALEHSHASTQPVPALLSQCWIFHLYWVHLEPSLNCAFCFNKHIILNPSSLPLHFLAKHSFKWLNHRAFPQIFVHEVMLKILISKQVDLGELKQVCGGISTVHSKISFLVLGLSVIPSWFCGSPGLSASTPRISHPRDH